MVHLNISRNTARSNQVSVVVHHKVHFMMSLEQRREGGGGMTQANVEGEEEEVEEKTRVR